MIKKYLIPFTLILLPASFSLANETCGIDTNNQVQSEALKFEISERKKIQDMINGNIEPSILKKYLDDFKEKFIEYPHVYDANGKIVQGRLLKEIRSDGKWIFDEIGLDGLPTKSELHSPQGARKYTLNPPDNKPVVVNSAEDAFSKNSGVYDIVGTDNKVFLLSQSDPSKRSQIEGFDILRVDHNKKQVTLSRQVGGKQMFSNISLADFNKRYFDGFRKNGSSELSSSTPSKPPLESDSLPASVKRASVESYQPQYEYKADYMSPSGKKAAIDPKEMAVITKDVSDQMAKAGFPRNAETINKIKTDPVYREKFFRQLGETFQDYNDPSQGGPFNKQYGERGAEVYKKGGDVCQILATGKGVCRETSIGMSATLADYGITSTVRTGNTTKKPYDGRHAWVELSFPDGSKAVMNGNWGKDGFYPSADEYYKKTGYKPDSNQTLFTPK